MAKSATVEGEGGAGLRLDRWLWHARLYKTRALAAAAIGAGHVKVNGARAKPARVVRSGDQIELSRSGRDFECHVRALPVRRGPAPEARGAYLETQESIARGLRYAENQRLGAFAAPRPLGRPDKKARRELLALSRAQSAHGDVADRAAMDATELDDEQVARESHAREWGRDR